MKTGIYEISVKKKFPCPKRHSEIKDLADLKTGDTIFDRTNLKVYWFVEVHDEESNLIEIAYSSGLCCIVNAVWYVLKD